ncbi:hypothetical protein [Salinispira pacifica]|uniref:hypothetical protein n=1 Tax=Salinispira pacifica TaxID=1307761 RepID=UPI00059E5B15
MKNRKFLLLFILLLAFVPGRTGSRLHAYRLIYREQLYELHHRQLYNYPLDIAENIHWLETALRADFANPLNALARIESDREWDKYRPLFTMHLNLKLTELYLLWATGYYKFDAYFYNYPWKEQNLESLEKSETLLTYALVYWDEARKYAAEAGEFQWLYLEEVQFWEDELYRIQQGELDYRRIINKHLDRLREVRSEFEAMDSSTY